MKPRTTVRVKKESDTAPSAVPQVIESHLQTKQAAVSASERLREFEDIRPIAKIQETFLVIPKLESSSLIPRNEKK